MSCRSCSVAIPDRIRHATRRPSAEVARLDAQEQETLRERQARERRIRERPEPLADEPPAKRRHQPDRNRTGMTLCLSSPHYSRSVLPNCSHSNATLSGSQR